MLHTLNESRRYFFGVILIFGVVLLWVGSSFLINAIFTNQSYDKPFFLTYFNTGTFSLYLIVVFIQRKLKKNKKNDKNSNPSSPLVSPEDSTKKYGIKDLSLEPISTTSSEEEQRNNEASEHVSMLSDYETAKLSLTFCVLWFLANWSNNLSLAYTSVASSTILSSTSGVFTLILGSLFNVEKFSINKLSGIAVSLLGVVLVGLSDMKSDSNLTFSSMVLGDVLSLLGAMFYGLYTTFLKYKVDEDRVDTRLFLGLVGLINLIIMIPIIIILHFTGFEHFDLPPSSTVWGMLFLNGLLGTFLSDYLWIWAVLLTSPLVVTLGLSLTIPFAMVGDVIFKGASISTTYGCGALFVILGFFIINSIAYREQVRNS